MDIDWTREQCIVVFVQRALLLRAMISSCSSSSSSLDGDIIHTIVIHLVVQCRVTWTRAALVHYRRTVDAYDHATGVDARHAMLEGGWAVIECIIYDPWLWLDRLDAHCDAREVYGRLLMRWLFLTTANARFVCERDCFPYALARMIQARHPIAFIWQAMLAPDARTVPQYDPFANLLQHMGRKAKWSDDDARMAITGVQHCVVAQQPAVIATLIAIWHSKRALHVGEDPLIRELNAQFTLMRDGGGARGENLGNAGGAAIGQFII